MEERRRGGRKEKRWNGRRNLFHLGKREENQRERNKEKERKKRDDSRDDVIVFLRVKMPRARRKKLDAMMKEEGRRRWEGQTKGKSCVRREKIFFFLLV